MYSKISKLPFRTATVLSMMIGLIGINAQSTIYAQGGDLGKSLGFKPSQPDVDYDIPTGDRLKGCEVTSSSKVFGLPGYVVHDAAGQILRLFLDRNKDRTLDRWSYYKDGIEVYRDSDNNFNNALDEFRWMGNAGTRIGKDLNEDRVIDSWENISVEEVAMEAFAAIRTRDQNRFSRLLLTEKELNELGLSGKVGEDVAKRLKAAQRGFTSMVRGQNQVTEKSKFVHSGNGQPGVAAANKTDGISKDIVCYDHASTVFENNGKFGNLALGTVVRVGNNWRLFELPEIVDPKKPIRNGGALFPMQMIEMNGGKDFPDVNPKLVTLFEDLDASEKALAKLIGEGNPKRNAVRIATMHKNKALLGIEIFKSVPAKERSSWLKTITDNVTNAYSEEQFPSGLSFLDDFSKKLAGENIRDGLDYIRWRSIYAEYNLKQRTAPNQGRKRALDKLLTDLAQFYKDFPKSEFAPEALHQLGQNNEVENKKAAALQWYQELARKFPNKTLGKRGQGAIDRIQGKGKRLSFKGTTVGGKTFDLSGPIARGKIVVLHFWDTGDTFGFDDLRKVSAKYPKEVLVIGANIDEKTETFTKYMKANPNVNWTQLHAPGGMEESPLAIQVGLVAQPMAMIFNDKGELVEDNIAFGDLEREIQRLLR